VFIFGDMIAGRSRLLRFIGKYGLTIMEKFHLGILSIILMATRSITRLETWKSCLLGRIHGCTSQILKSFEPTGKMGGSKSPDLSPLSPNGERRILMNLKRCIGKMAFGNLRGRLKTCQNGEKTIQKRHERHIKMPPGLRSRSTSASLSVLVVDLVFFPPIALLSIAVRVATLGSKTSERLQKRRVFNIHVEDTHEFFANGILVHNCMSLAIGVYTMGCGTPWREKLNVSDWLPPDLRPRGPVRGMVRGGLS
jgi:hypothetical protein